MKNLLTAALFIIVIQLFVNQPIADMYKWIDQNGVTHYSDTPPVSEQNVETIETPNYPQQSPKSVPVKSKINTKPNSKEISDKKAGIKRNSRVKSKNKVEIYTTSWCRYCKSAIEFLRSNRIKFKQYDIERDPKAAAKMKALGGTGGVPFAIINGKQVYGFSMNSYKKALGIY